MTISDRTTNTNAVIFRVRYFQVNACAAIRSNNTRHKLLCLIMDANTVSLTPNAGVRTHVPMVIGPLDQHAIIWLLEPSPVHLQHDKDSPRIEFQLADHGNDFQLCSGLTLHI